MKILGDDLGDQPCGLSCPQSQFVVDAFSATPVPQTSPSAYKTTSKSDKVVFSPFAQELNQARQWLDQVPDIRLETVNTLRQKIAMGDYVPDERVIAANMIGETLVNQLSII